MDENTADFRVASVYADGSEEEPQVYRLDELDAGWPTDRRGFMKTTALAAGALASALSGCHPRRRAVRPFSPNRAHRGAVRALAVTPDGRHLCSGGDDSTVRIWTLPNGALATRVGVSGRVDAVAAAGAVVYWGGSRLKSVGRVSLETGRGMQPLPDAGGGVHALVVTPDETMLFAGCADGTIASWSVPDGTRRDSLSGHKTGVIQLGITPDGAFLCSEGADGAVRVWALPGGEMVHELQGNEHHPVLTVGSPDRSVFLTNAGAAVERRTVPDCAVSGTFDEGGLLSGVRERTGGSRSFVSALRVTPDGSLLAAAHAEPGSPTSARNRDNAIRLWDVEASRLLGKLQGHLEPVDALAITADSRILCSGAEDGTIRLWSLPAGEALNSLIDLEVTPSVGKGRVYTATNMYGTQVRYTLPCGSPIPPGAVCSCDCVPGSYAPPVRRRSGGGRICTCNRICTCVPIK